VINVFYLDQVYTHYIYREKLGSFVFMVVLGLDCTFLQLKSLYLFKACKALK